MARLALAAALAALLPGAALAQNGSPPPAAADEPMAVPAGAALVWSDEFDTPGAPDRKKWRYDTSRNKLGWYNNELQYYAANRRENVRVEGGSLVIEARQERLAARDDYGGQDYSSGKLVTEGLGSWQYGFIEVRAKLACGKGVWPAIWMLGTDGSTGWPALGEIDVMEHVGWDEGVVHGTIHTKAYNHVAGTQKGATTKVADACTAFHSYQLDWNPDRILIGVDGHAYMRFDNDHKGNHDSWPFASPQYLILNVAIGGWGGQQGIDLKAFPSRMDVDYVRVWQKR
ncbi:MAG: glycoside hydrolase family 16 protein [Pseudomonadota bacterium]